MRAFQPWLGTLCAAVRLLQSGSRRVRDDGSAALELVVLAPVLFALLGMLIAAGRITIAQGSIDAAARDAARQASISLSPTAAQVAALTSARAVLQQDGLGCVAVVVIDTSQFSIPSGEPASVTATVTCRISLASLALPGLPGSVTLTAAFTSPLDVYRAR